MIGNHVYRQRYQGFESPPLRHMPESGRLRKNLRRPFSCAHSKVSCLSRTHDGGSSPKPGAGRARGLRRPASGDRRIPGTEHHPRGASASGALLSAIAGAPRRDVGRGRLRHFDVDHPGKPHENLGNVFPGLRPGKVLSENTLNAALTTLGFGPDVHRVHGFRSSASTILNELAAKEGGRRFNFEHVEAQLAHRSGNAVRDAYQRSTFLEQRRLMMQAWADECDRLRVLD